MGKTKTRTAFWKLITKKDLTPKEGYKVDELLQNIKVGIVTLLVVVALVYLINTAGCFNERLS
jgi:hypothetical protein